MKADSSRAKLLVAFYDNWKASVDWEHSGLIDEEAAVLAGLSLESEYATRCSELRKADPPLLVMVDVERIGRAGVGRGVSRLTRAGRAFVEMAGWR